jgi:chromosome segregation ATPase
LDNIPLIDAFYVCSVDKERELLKNELTKIRKQVQSSEVIIENQRVEIMKLQRIIEEADQESQRQKNELTAVLSERNLLTAQLVKRNAELSEMYHRIKIHRSNLRMGERNFHQYVVDMRVLKEQLHETVMNHNDTIVKLAKADQVRGRMFQLKRDLLKEQTKTRALMDELETPMNVHRWRILESSDPKRYDKIVQISSLQKQLVAMSDKVTQTDLLVQEKEKIYVELKNVISRQPGPEVEEQILVYQQTLKDKTKQLAAMNQELSMYIEQVAAFKDEISTNEAKMTKMNKLWMRRVKKTRELNQ